MYTFLPVYITGSVGPVVAVVVATGVVGVTVEEVVVVVTSTVDVVLGAITVNYEKSLMILMPSMTLRKMRNGMESKLIHIKLEGNNNNMFKIQLCFIFFKALRG